MAGRTLGVADAEPTFDTLTVTNATVLNGNAAIGNAAADLVAFHGATAVDQADYIAPQSVNALSVSGVIGFASSASMSVFIGKVNSILTLLSEKGLMAAS